MRHALGFGLAAALLAGCAGQPVPVASQTPLGEPTNEAIVQSATPTEPAPAGGGELATDTTAPQSTPEQPAPEPQKPLAGRVIVIDPGHNGGASAAFNNRRVPAGNGRMKACNTSGTATRSGLTEHAVNFTLARALADALAGEGAQVVLTRTTDTGAGPCVNDRAAIGNRAGADAVISLHADGNLSSTARGFHVIRSTTMVGGPAVEDASTALAQRVVSEFERTGMPRSTYTGGKAAITARDDIAGLNLLTVPGVMLEAGNMHHPTDARLLASPEFVQAEVAALTRAVEGWLTQQ